jgi:hypothetical protein
MHIAMLHCLNIMKRAEVTGLMPEKQASLTKGRLKRARQWLGCEHTC